MIAFLAVSIVVTFGRPGYALGELRRHPVLYFAIGAYVVAAIVSQIYSPPAYETGDILRMGFYICSLASLSAWVARATPQQMSIMALVAPASLAVIAISFILYSSAGGINLAELLWKGIVTADPQVIQHGVFRAVFAVSAEAAQANWRHHIVSALLLNAVLSLSFLHVIRNMITRLLVLAGVLGAGALLILSLSRAIILSAALGAIVVLVGALLMRRGGMWRMAILIGGFVLIASVLASPIGELVAVRFLSETQGESYNARIETLAAGISMIERRIIWGGPASHGRDMHNIVLQHWIGAGVFGAIAALGLLAGIGSALYLLFKRAVHMEFRMGYPLLLVAGLLMLPIVRAVTAGGGLAGAEWLCIGLAFGILARDRRHTSGSSRYSTQRGLVRDG